MVQGDAAARWLEPPLRVNSIVGRTSRSRSAAGPFASDSTGPSRRRTTATMAASSARQEASTTPRSVAATVSGPSGLPEAAAAIGVALLIIVAMFTPQTSVAMDAQALDRSRRDG